VGETKKEVERLEKEEGTEQSEKDDDDDMAGEKSQGTVQLVYCRDFPSTYAWLSS